MRCDGWQVVKGKIGLLKLMGSNFRFESLDEKAITDRDRTKAKHSDEFYWPVMIVVVIFSVVVVIVIFSILCSNSSPRECTDPQNLWSQGFT